MTSSKIVSIIWEIERCVLFCYNVEEYVAEEEDEAATASNDPSTANFTLCLDPGLHIKDLCLDDTVADEEWTNK